MNKLATLVIFCLLPLSGTMAQLFHPKKEKQVSELITQPGRVEFEIENGNYQDYIVTGCQEEGISLCHKTENKEKEGYLWEFIRLDTALSTVWQRDMYLPFGTRIIGYDYSPGFVNYLIRQEDYKQEELVLLRVNLQRGDTSRFYINTVIPVVPTELHVLGNTVLLGVQTDYKAFIFRYNLVDKRPQIIPGFYDEYGEILRITTDDRLRVFTVTMKERMPDLRTTVSVRSFSEGGDMMRNIHLEPDESKSLLNGAPTNLKLDRQFVAGTYAHKRLTYSSGIYIARLGNSSQQSIQYIDYGELDHFFSYLSASKERRMKKKIDLKKANGQEMKFHYRLNLHDIIQNGDYYTLFGEVYYNTGYPSYALANYSASVPTPGLAGHQYSPAFSSFKYTHSVVITFDQSGKLLWDGSFEINDVDNSNLEDVVNVATSGDETVLVYAFENTIRSKILKEDKIIEGKTFNDISLSVEGDEAWGGRNQPGNLSRWYGMTFFTYGVRDIENLRSQEAGYYRRVFFINKISFR
ncbi:MAG: hypothetical protein ACMVP2_00660 [Imperialibacter sp.]|uniref:hypothetical protein n=1 Tax=Imperialibacter sp. TaxID=2038411 RepID=UPI003A88BDE6